MGPCRERVMTFAGSPPAPHDQSHACIVQRSRSALNLDDELQGFSWPLPTGIAGVDNRYPHIRVVPHHYARVASLLLRPSSVARPPEWQDAKYRVPKIVTQPGRGRG